MGMITSTQFFAAIEILESNMAEFLDAVASSAARNGQYWAAGEAKKAGIAYWHARLESYNNPEAMAARGEEFYKNNPLFFHEPD